MTNEGHDKNGGTKMANVLRKHDKYDDRCRLGK